MGQEDVFFGESLLHSVIDGRGIFFSVFFKIKTLMFDLI